MTRRTTPDSTTPDSMWRTMWTRLRGDAGATAIEYAIMVGLVAVVIVAAVAFLGGQTSNNFDCTARSWQTQANAC